MKGINILTVKDFLTTIEANLETAYYVGDERARLVKKAATTSVYEYLNG